MMIIRAYTKRGSDGLGVECVTSAESHTKLVANPQLAENLYRDLRDVLEKHADILGTLPSEQTHW